MKFEVKDKLFTSLLYAFLGFGACSYGCMFVTYVLWFLGVID